MNAPQTMQHDPAFDPNCDPEKLAAIGRHVRANLEANPAVHRVDTDGADIYTVDRFLTRRDCKAIMAEINSNAIPSEQYLGKNGVSARTSYTHHFEPDAPLTRSIELYISALLGIDDAYSELMQGQRYQVGQEFKHHHDFFHVGEGYWKLEAPKGGQRTWTAMICLHEASEGGETDFPHLGLAFKPVAGQMVIWNNMDRAGRANMKTLHAGMPVKRGVKHIITKWYRQEPWRLLNPAG